MPYVKVPGVYRIVFDPITKPETTVPGLVMVSRALKFGAVFSLSEFAGLSGGSAPTPDDKALFYRGVQQMLDALTEWDMTDENGLTVPLTIAAFEDLDFLQGIEILETWIDVQMGNVSDPKARSSATGLAPDPDMPMPMETL